MPDDDNAKMPDVPDSTLTRGQARDLLEQNAGRHSTVPPLNGIKVQDATHKIICFIDSLPLNEPERYAALLAATYTQKQFMLEDCEHNASAVPIVERLHDETMEALRNAK